MARPGLKLRVFCWPLRSHPVISSTTLHLKATRVTYYPLQLKFFHELPESFFKEFTRNHFSAVGLLSLVAKCNRWKMYILPLADEICSQISAKFLQNVTSEKLWIDPDLNPGSFADRAVTTELQSHLVISPTTFHLKPAPITLTAAFLTFYRWLCIPLEPSWLN